MTPPFIRPTLRGLVLALAVTALSSFVATAHPYATCLTNAAGIVSFRLNEDGGSVKVIGNGGTLTNDLGVINRGLTITNLTGSGMTGGVFQVEVTKSGSGAPSLISDNNNVLNHFEYPRGGVFVNKRPASPHFGRIYIANARAGITAGSNRSTGDGIYMLNSDHTDAVGQGDTARTGGLDFATGTTVSPWHITIGEDDDRIYICDWSDSAGNLLRADPNVSDGSGELVLKALASTTAPGNATVPVTSANNHGSINDAAVTGKLGDGNLTVYTVDEDYQTDPDAATMTEVNSLWGYVINSGPLPWGTAPVKIADSPALGYAQNTMGLARATNGYLYHLHYRSAGAQNCLQVVDPTGPTVLYKSRDDSVNNLGWPRDIMSNCVSVAVSRDMNYLAALRTSGLVVVVPLVNGLPNLAGRVEFSAISSSTSASRQLAFDAADNVVVADNISERLRVYSLGLTTTAKTTSNSTGDGGEGGSFDLSSPATTVSVTADTTEVYEAGPTTAVLTFTRTSDSLANPLTVVLTASGTATRGTDDVLQTNSVTFTGNTVIIPAAAASVTVSLVAQNDSTPELSETAIVGVSGTAFYGAGSPPSQTVYIVDNEKPTITIARQDAQVYERTNDFARFRLTRYGDTNVYLSQVNLTYGGTATAGTHVYGDASVILNAGEVTKDAYAYPIHDGAVTGPLTVTATVAAAGDGSYDVGTPGTSVDAATRVDSDYPAETVLWQDNLQTDTSANWTQLFATTNDAPYDATVYWGYEYSAPLAIPPAPRSGGNTYGLYMAVNKNDGVIASAALNFYPNSQSFSGNYALRFDMYLVQNSSSGQSEYALFGINHSGTKTNWFRRSEVGFTGVDPVGWSFDGVFFDAEADGANYYDYAAFSSPTTATRNPTVLQERIATTLAGVFKTPPWTPGSYGGGAPGNVYGSSTPIWADVEVAQVNGVIFYSINHTLIFAYTNTTGYNSGNVMLGYCDGWDSIGASGGAVIYANARVVSLAGPVITQIVRNGGNVEITFTANATDLPVQFALQEATPAVTGPYGDTASTITSLGGGAFKSVKAAGAGPAFYRIKKTIY